MTEKKFKIFFQGKQRLAKPLILLSLASCIAKGQFVEARMNSAFWLVKPRLHTKLSTEFVDSEKMPFATVI
jgi:hypothetical protein